MYSRPNFLAVAAGILFLGLTPFAKADPQHVDKIKDKRAVTSDTGCEITAIYELKIKDGQVQVIAEDGTLKGTISLEDLLGMKNGQERRFFAMSDLECQKPEDRRIAKAIQTLTSKVPQTVSNKDGEASAFEIANLKWKELKEAKSWISQKEDCEKLGKGWRIANVEDFKEARVADHNFSSTETYWTTDKDFPNIHDWVMSPDEKVVGGYGPPVFPESVFPVFCVLEIKPSK